MEYVKISNTQKREEIKLEFYKEYKSFGYSANHAWQAVKRLYSYLF